MPKTKGTRGMPQFRLAGDGNLRQYVGQTFGRIVAKKHKMLYDDVKLLE
jgi:hypothetical protein